MNRALRETQDQMAPLIARQKVDSPHILDAVELEKLRARISGFDKALHHACLQSRLAFAGDNYVGLVTGCGVCVDWTLPCELTGCHCNTGCRCFQTDGNKPVWQHHGAAEASA
jgi:hypothetical protein